MLCRNETVLILCLGICLVHRYWWSTRWCAVFVIDLNRRFKDSYFRLLDKIIRKSRIWITLKYRLYHTKKFIPWSEKFINLFKLKLLYFCHILFFYGNWIISSCPCSRGRNIFLWEILKLFQFRWWYLQLLLSLVFFWTFFRSLNMRVYFLLWGDFYIFTSFLYWWWGIFLIRWWTTDIFSWRAHITRKVINQQK